MLIQTNLALNKGYEMLGNIGTKLKDWSAKANPANVAHVEEGCIPLHVRRGSEDVFIGYFVPQLMEWAKKGELRIQEESKKNHKKLDKTPFELAIIKPNANEPSEEALFHVQIEVTKEFDYQREKKSSTITPIYKEDVQQYLRTSANSSLVVKDAPASVSLNLSKMDKFKLIAKKLLFYVLSMGLTTLIIGGVYWIAINAGLQVAASIGSALCAAIFGEVIKELAKSVVHGTKPQINFDPTHLFRSIKKVAKKTEQVKSMLHGYSHSKKGHARPHATPKQNSVRHHKPKKHSPAG